ncbi:hypothetical protein [Nonomuraea sp. B5E05]|uniref:WXG100-like domain-containing protein n=1 Tax=Nonomuraea sp. B5E05 TaxID=3153569 RepID=UPI00325FFE8C
MALGPSAKVTLGLMGGVGAVAALNPETILGVRYLEGDPEKIREAADKLELIADAIDRHQQQAHTWAEKVWTENNGRDYAEFQKFWEGKFGLAVFATAYKYRRAAEACRAYADVIEKTNYALKVLCAILIADLIFTTGYQLVTWKIFRAIARKQALLIKNYGETFTIKYLLPYLVYPIADSFAYAAGEVAIPFAINSVAGMEKDLSGNDVLSLDHNVKEYGSHFLSNMAFDGVADATAYGMQKVPGLRMLNQNIPLPNGWQLNTGTIIPRMAGTTMYSVTRDLTYHDNPLPGSETGLTAEEMYQKLLAHGSRGFIPRR